MTSELPSRNVVTGGGKGTMEEQGLSAQRVLQGVWRRRKVCLAVALVIFALGAATVAGAPNVYRASTVVRVEQHRMSPELVNATVTQQIEDRLKTIQAELFSRPILERAVEELNLYPDTVKKSGTGAAAEELRRHLDVKVEGDNAFELTFEDGNAETAAKVANRLPELFADEALKVRAAQTEQAQQLFGDELQKLSVQAGQQEQKINEFKVAHLGELPEQMEANMRTMERLTMLLGTKGDNLRDAQRRLQDAMRGHIDANSDAGRLAVRESEVKNAFDTAKSQYTSDHPEVQRLSRELATVHNQRITAENQARASDTTRAEAAAEVKALTAELATLQQQLDTYRQRIDNTPRWSVPLAELNRQYDALKAKYDQMLSRKVEADVAHDLEMRARAQTFHVLSTAEAPTSPVRPDRAAGFMLVGLVALALGLLAGVVLEMQDDTLREVSDAHNALRLPVLAVVPDLGKKPVLGTGKTLRPAVNRTTLDA